jgi:adenine C2-methylase RlmN of 23S rRNA A2503 and tRNA A37
MEDKVETLDIIQVKNKYSGSNWNREVCCRYIISLGNDDIIEASYFEHYNDSVFIKYVLELPLTVGCNFGCKFCASSRIKSYRKLSWKEIYGIYVLIAGHKNLRDRHLISFTGIGEITNNLENIRLFIDSIKDKSKVEFTFSTMNFNKKLIDFIKAVGRDIIIRKFQISYVSHNAGMVSGLVPFYINHEYNIKNIIALIKQNNIDFIRINYIVIKGYNDNFDEYNKFISLFDHIKHLIRVRISKLNKTEATDKFSLGEPTISVLDEFNSLLLLKGFDSYVFYSYKNDNMNCGQLIYTMDTCNNVISEAESIACVAEVRN